MGVPLANVQTRKIRLSDIVVRKRLRGLSDNKVRDIAKSVSLMGLLYPVLVRKASGGRFDLLAGNHRLEAFRLLGEKTIPAKVVGCTDDVDATLVEIDDNLCRNDLTVMETVVQLRLKEDLLASRGERAKSGFPLARSGKTGATTAQMAKDVNIPERRYQNLLQISRGIPAPLAHDTIMGRPLGNHIQALLEISRISDKKMQKAIVVKASRIEDVSTAKVLQIISAEMRKRNPGAEYHPLTHSAHGSKSAERVFIERFALIVKRAAEKVDRLSSKRPAIVAARGMIEQLRLVLEAAGVSIETDIKRDDYAGVFLSEAGQDGH